MRKSVTTLLIACFMIASFSGINVSGDDNASIEIGRYERITGSGDLSSDHIEQTAAGVRVRGPVFTNTLRVAEDFLESEIGSAWSANKPFVIEDGEAVVSDRFVEFSPLEVGSSAVFTMGSRDQVQFQERPMWVSAQQNELGATITLDMDDGDSSGQEVFIAKQWLWERGIHRPLVVHEDGTELSAVPTQQRDGWVIDIHHFSYVELTALDEVVFSKQDGVVVPHTGQQRWYEDEERLEVDVGYECAPHARSCSSSDHVLYVDKDWVDQHISSVALEEHPWELEVHNFVGTSHDDYYTVYLNASDVPTTLNFLPFYLGETWLFSLGDPGLVNFAPEPVFVKDEGINPGNYSIQVKNTANVSASLSANLSMLAQINVTSPLVITDSAFDLNYSMNEEHVSFDIYSLRNITIRDRVDLIMQACTEELGELCATEVEGDLRDTCLDRQCAVQEIHDEISYIAERCLLCDFSDNGTLIMIDVSNDLFEKVEMLCDLEDHNWCGDHPCEVDPDHEACGWAEEFCTGTIENWCEGLMGLISGYRETVYGDEEGSSPVYENIPPWNDRVHTTDDGQGEWTLTLNPNVPDEIDLVPQGSYASISLPPIPDVGEIRQFAKYFGDNPWPEPYAFEDQPPPTDSELETAGAICLMYLAIAIGSAFVPGGAGFATGAAISAGMACGAWLIMMSDEGKWGAEGEYMNCWGAGDCGGAKSRWEGEFLNLGAILSLTSSVLVDGKTEPPSVGYKTPSPYEGYHAQRKAYQSWDAEARSEAYGKWKNWGAQGSSAQAEITLEIPILERVLDDAQELLRIGQGGDFCDEATQGEGGCSLWLLEDLNEIIFSCISCSDTAIVSIESPGEGVIIPQGQNVELNFAGTPGEATINVLGVDMNGFTLDGEFEGEGTGAHEED